MASRCCLACSRATPYSPVGRRFDGSYLVPIVIALLVAGRARLHGCFGDFEAFHIANVSIAECWTVAEAPARGARGNYLSPGVLARLAFKKFRCAHDVDGILGVDVDVGYKSRKEMKSLICPLSVEFWK